MITRLLTARPARQVLPVFLLALGMAAATVHFLLQLSEVAPTALRETTADVNELLVQHARRVDAQAELGISRIPTRLVGSLAMYPSVNGAWLVDGQGQVQASIYRRDIGQSFDHVVARRPQDVQPALRQALDRGRAVRIALPEGQPQVVVARQVLLGVDPSRYGMFIIEADSTPLAASLRADAGQQFWRSTAVLIGLVVLVWVMFHLAWGERSRRLAEAARQLQFDDKPLATGITGGDELAQLARALESASSRISRQARLLHTISRVSLVAQRFPNREALGLEICRLLVEEGGYAVAGLARVEADGHSVVPTALVGATRDQLPIQDADLDDPGQAARPAVHVLLTGETMVFRDLDADPARHPATEPFHRLGMRSLAVVPLIEMGQRLGVLFLADRGPHAFDGDFIKAITAAAGDIGSNIILRERERAASELEHRFAMALGAAQLGAWSSNLATGEMTANAEWFRMLGLDPARDSDVAGNWRDRLHPDDVKVLDDAYLRVGQPGTDTFEADLRLRHAAGHWVWIHSRGTVLGRDAAGHPQRLAGVHMDMTARRRDEMQLRIAADAFDNSHEGILICDSDGAIISVNRSFERLTGYGGDEVIGRRPSMLSSGHHDEEFYRDMWATIHDRGRWEGEVWNRRKSGEIFPEWLVITRITHADGRVNYLGQFSDITESKQVQSRMDELSRTDALTGLPNRKGFAEHVRLRLASGPGRFAVVMHNVDRFKQVNDSLGYTIGDDVLVQLARLLATTYGEDAVVARVSGDEFAALLPDAGKDEVLAATARVDERMQQPFEAEGQQLVLGLSSGAALFPEHGSEAEILLVSANAALNLSRAEGQRQLCIYSPGLPGASLTRLTLESQLRLAMQRDELFAVYQPQVSLLTGELVGLEALVRWRHPERGVVPPGEFIPVAEETGLVSAIGDLMLRQSCQALKRMWEAGLPQVPVSVNISPGQLRRPDFLPQLMTEVESAGLPPSALEIEIVESMLMSDVDKTITLLKALRQRGFRVAVDDFGTGYSSLAYLSRLPLDRLKIDQSFVMDLRTSASAAGIVTAVIALARSLNLNVLAEGVEEPEDAARLLELGCDDAQGYLYARPLTEADLLAKYLPPA